jgi:hypothetical protein
MMCCEAVLEDSCSYTLLLGKAVGGSDALFDALLQHKPLVYLALDSDAQEDAQSISKHMTEWGLDVRIVPVPDGYKDFGELLPLCAQEYYRNKVVRSFREAHNYDPMHELFDFF